MNHNNRILTKGQLLLIILLAAPIFILSQAQAQDIALDPEEPDSVHWQVNALLNPFVSVLLSNGGDMGSANPMGLQFKRFKGDHAIRWNVEYDPNRSIPWGNSNLANVKERNGDVLRLVNSDFMQHQFRAGMGFERGSVGKLGRRYFGADVALTYRYTRHWSFQSFYNIEEERFLLEEGLGAANPTRHLSAVGAGFKPFIGLERPLNDRWGFNLEAKLDFVAQYTEGYTIMDDGSFQSAPDVIYFETYPLLEVRLYYNL
jgi:hypothetical protein